MAFLASVVAAVIFGFEMTSECIWGSLVIEEVSVIGSIIRGRLVD